MNTKNYYAFLNNREQENNIPNLFLFSITIPEYIQQIANEQFETVLKSPTFKSDFVTLNEIENNLIFQPENNPIFYNKNLKAWLKSESPSEDVILSFSGYRLLSEKDEDISLGCTCFTTLKIEQEHPSSFLDIPQKISDILKQTIGEDNFIYEMQAQLSLDGSNDWKELDTVYDFVSNYEKTSQLKQQLNSNLSQAKNKKNTCKI